MRTLVRTSWARCWMILAVLSAGCGGGPVRDRARTAADLTRERPAPLSAALTEAERQARTRDVDELAAHIDARLASSDTVSARELFARLPGPAPTLNRLAITDASLRDDAWVEEVEALMALDDPGIACGAARLLETSGAGTQTDIDAACARSGELPPRSGTFWSGGTFDFQFSLSARTGFDSQLEVVLEPWLLVAP